MENPGCVTFRDEFLFPSAVTRAERQLRGMVIAHEMAHMWFGDLVTMRWWNDVWLSESFAEYLGFGVLAEATAFTGAWTDFALARKVRGYDADQRGVHPPGRPGAAGGARHRRRPASYDDISYAKGAAALRQLVAWLGWPAFLAGINDYFARYRFGSATLADLLDCLSRASGADVGEWAGPWLRSAGRGHPGGQPPGAAGPGRVRQPRRRAAAPGLDRGVRRGTGRAHAARPGTRCWCRPTRARSCCRPPRSGPSPPCCCRTTAISATARSGSIRPRRTPWPPRSAAWPIRSAARWPGTASATWSGTASSRRGSTSPWRPGTCPPRPTAPSPGTCIGYARWTIADRYLPPGLRGAALADITSLCRDLLSPQPAGRGRRDAAGRRARADRQRVRPGRRLRAVVLAGRRAGTGRAGPGLPAPLADPAPADGARRRQPGRDRARRRPGRHRGRAAQRGALPGRAAGRRTPSRPPGPPCWAGHCPATS